MTNTNPLEIEFSFTEYDEHYNAEDWFKDGAQTIYEAEDAETPEEAHKILLNAYKGDDVDGVQVFWYINGVTYRPDCGATAMTTTHMHKIP